MGKSKKVKTQHAQSVPYKKPEESKAKQPIQVTRCKRPTIPFHNEDRILLIGEGDFSFARSIVEHLGCGDVTATCFDSREELSEKYNPQGEENVTFLEEDGSTVLFNVDATALGKHKQLKAMGRFDRIFFNFPHVGGKSKDVNRQVRFNQELLVKFFSSALPFVANDGTIIVTLFDGEPYTLWNIKDLARHSGLAAQRSFAFQANAYPGYSHARTLGNIEGGGGWKGEDRPSRTYVFELKKDDGPGKKRNEDDSD